MSKSQRTRPQSASQTIVERHSIHSFNRELAVPHDVLEKVFEQAQNSASNFNIQPWEVKVITDDKLDRIQKQLVEIFQSGRLMELPETPPKFKDRVEHMAAVKYSEGFGIAREDKAARHAAATLNFKNYGAPCLMLFCIDKSLAVADIASVGIYLENIILLLWENGLGSIPQASMGG